MTIKEIEECLGVPRATVRFYEKEGLIKPERGENGYRDYSDADISILKKIITLRKVGMSVADIENILDGVKTLEEVVYANVAQLKEQIEELSGALKISRILQDKRESIQTYDEEYYWTLINSEEEKGNRFFDIAKDLGKYEKNVVLSLFGLEDSEGGLSESITKAIWKVFVTIALCGITYMALDWKWSLNSFIKGVIWPFEVIAILAIFGVPFYFLKKKYPEKARKIKHIVEIIGLVVVVGLLILAFVSR